MGNKFVTLDKNNIIQEPFDEDNNNVPDGAVPISEDDFLKIRSGEFDDFKFIDGIIVSNEEKLITKAKEAQKARLRIEKLDSMLVLEFAEIDAAATEADVKKVKLK